MSKINKKEITHKTKVNEVKNVENIKYEPILSQLGFIYRGLKLENLNLGNSWKFVTVNKIWSFNN